MKKCADCKQEKALDRFSIHSPWYCKDCLNRRQREYQRRKREEKLKANPPVVRTEKLCPKCGLTKPNSEFYLLKGRWLYQYCKPCSSEIGQLRRKIGGKPFERLRYRCNKVGVQVEWFLAQMEKQKNVCAICESPEIHPHKRGGDKIRSLAIDHDHKTGKIRGLLCFRCNTALYQLELHGRQWAHKAVAYLDEHQGDNNGDIPDSPPL